MKLVYQAGELAKETRVVRVADVHNAGLPIHLALGRLEAATQEELDELITDLTHERDRRVS